MHTFPTQKFLTLPTSLGNRDHDINSHYLPLHCVSSYGALAHNYGNLRLSGEKLPGPKSFLLETKKKCPIQNSLRSVSELDAKCPGSVGSPKAIFPPEKNVLEKDKSGRHFLFDRRWKNGEFRDEMYLKPTSAVCPLPRPYRVQKSNNFQRFSLFRQACNNPSKPCCPFEGYDLTSVPSRLLPATSAVPEKSFSVDIFKHRSRISNRTCSLFTIGANHKSQFFPDPVAGAPASFIQRLSEISSLEGETLRQEKMKKMKKSRKQD
ncbi:uncharacterized protein si:ch211-171b20.3 [Sardina pilchardus]|uniref:uncharacterized protein si:ch211-171b20.3 n=1 Tax=Sardina pilchardus TaxID=27697 RepID=UPI002E1546DE